MFWAVALWEASQLEAEGRGGTNTRSLSVQLDRVVMPEFQWEAEQWSEIMRCEVQEFDGDVNGHLYAT